jgi:hypothetical protein
VGDQHWHKRLYWFKQHLYSSMDKQDDGLAPVPTTEEKANLIGSLTDKGMHMPLLDIDYDAALIPSSTPGHFHLYLNKAIKWDVYKKFLEAAAEAGIIQKGYADWSLARSQSFLRKPGVKKEPVPTAEEKNSSTEKETETPF